MELQTWFMENMPEEKMRFNEPARDQIKWVRDKLTYLLKEHVHPDAVCRVYDTHTSKSIVLPVYTLRTRTHTITVRGNFHDWCIKVNKGFKTEIPSYLYDPSHTGYYEGMPEKAFFKACVGTQEELYALVQWMVAEGIER